MGKFNTEIVEMTKLINRSPIDSFWVYCEMDLTFFIIGSSSKIKVRTDDRILSGSEAELIIGTTSRPIDIGTYAIGTYSTQHTVCGTISTAEYGRYILVVATQGYGLEVLNFTQSMGSYGETIIPNILEESVEWIGEENVLRPIIKEITRGGYAIGASYSSLTRRGNF